MSSKTRRIFAVCAIGTMAGLFTAIKLSPFFWWLGALIGGITSGFLYGLPDIVRCAPTAARYVWRTLTYLPRVWQLLVSKYRELRELPPLKKWQVASVVMFVVLLVSWLGGLFPTVRLLNSLPELSRSAFLFFIIIGSLFYLCSAEMVMLYAIMFGEEESDAVRIRRAQRAFIFATPIIGPPVSLVWILIMVVRAIPRFVAIIPEGCRFLWEFAITLFILVHSRELVLCFVDGALGVIISYPLFVVIGNLQLGPTLLAGGLTGGLLGVFHYEFISRRLLHFGNTVKTR